MDRSKLRKQVVVHAQQGSKEAETINKKLSDLQKELTQATEKAKSLEQENHALARQSGINENLPKTIDEIESQLFALRKAIDRSGWLIGQRLAHIRDQRLYTSSHDSFEGYCEEKFEFSRRTAYRFIYYFENYTLETTLSHGSKLLLLQGLDDARQNQYLKLLNEQSLSYRQLEQKIKAENDRAKKPVSKAADKIKEDDKEGDKDNKEPIVFKTKYPDTMEVIYYDDLSETITVDVSGVKSKQSFVKALERLLLQYSN